jgi:hypothetical protein
MIFEGAVITVGDYYYDERTKSIEKRSNKRKGESLLNPGHLQEEFLNGKPSMTHKIIPYK